MKYNKGSNSNMILFKHSITISDFYRALRILHCQVVFPVMAQLMKDAMKSLTSLFATVHTPNNAYFQLLIAWYNI